MLLVKTNCVDNAKKIWWDIRLHPFFDTLEIRICDAQSRVDDTIALAAMIQAIIYKLHKLQRQNLTFRIYRRRLIDENRWRASRYGLSGKLIDFGAENEVDERELIHEMLDFVGKEVDELGSANEIAHVENIPAGGFRGGPAVGSLEAHPGHAGGDGSNHRGNLRGAHRGGTPCRERRLKGGRRDRRVSDFHSPSP